MQECNFIFIHFTYQDITRLLVVFKCNGIKLRKVCLYIFYDCLQLCLRSYLHPPLTPFDLRFSGPFQKIDVGTAGVRGGSSPQCTGAREPTRTEQCRIPGALKGAPSRNPGLMLTARAFWRTGLSSYVQCSGWKRKGEVRFYGNLKCLSPHPL